MSLIDNIKSKLNRIRESETPFDFSISTRGVPPENEKKPYLSFFKNGNERNERKWEIEISVSLINDAWENGELNSSVFLKNCTDALLKKFQITNLSGIVPETYEVKYDNDLSISTAVSRIFSNYTELFNSGFHGANTIIFNDGSKSGKTTFIKYYCNELLTRNVHNSPKIWWLDFNNGSDAVLLDFLLKLYDQKRQDTNHYLIIDNLECCGYTKGANIANFFIELVNMLKSNGMSIKLIIIQDNNRKCYAGSSDANKKIHVPTRTIGVEIKNEHLEEELISSHYERIKNDVRTLLNGEQIDLRTKTYFINIIFFSKYGVNLRINKKYIADKEDILTIEKYVRGIKLMSSGEIISFPVSICSKILEQFGDIIKEILMKFNSVLIDKDKNFNSNVLECYYTYLSENSLPLSINDFYTILRIVGEKNKNIKNYLTILKKAEDANNFITDTILDETKSGKTQFFDYHLGAMLFAGETLTTYASQNWDSLKAWIKLHEHIKKTFYIEGQEIYIWHGRERYDNTIWDFRADDYKPPKNCIYNQMKLHDEVLGQCSALTYTELPDANVENIWSHENKEGLFGFYMSPIQNESEHSNDKVDIDKFYRTYILALLFEFEVMAPEQQFDTVRIEKLWNKIKNNCVKSDKFDCQYFYPARVPWVTARMALAMSACLNNYGRRNICDEIEQYIKGVGEYLAKSSIKFVRDGKTYRFWSSGTGLWNSTLETTIICAFALKEFSYAEFKNIVEEGINFINLFKDNWFNDNMVADGIWAYQTTEYFSSTNVYDKLKSFVYTTGNVDFTRNDNNKNDKSLGLSHVAKTLIDVVKDFIAVKPDLLNLSDEIIENDGHTDLSLNEQATSDIVDLAIEKVEKWVEEHSSSKNQATLQADEYKSLIDEFSPSYGQGTNAQQRLVKAQTFLRTVSTNNYKINAEAVETFKEYIKKLAQKIGKGELLED